MDEFLDVYSYLLTKSMVYELSETGSSEKYLNEKPIDWLRSDNIWVRATSVFIRSGLNTASAAPDIGAWQIERDSRVPTKERVLLGKQDNKDQCLNETTKFAARKARFLRNDTASPDKTNMLPYNSTIWLDGKEQHLQAPFLNTSSKCSKWFDGGLGVCLCLNGVPIDQPIDTHNPTGCISDTGYSWGFSGGVLGVALMLEGIWVFMTWTMWRWARARSTMVFMRRTGAGTIRNILDAAEVITEHLGDQHSAYTEKELSKQLQSSPPFGYVLETRNGVQHIGLRPIPTPSGDEETVLRKRAMVEHDTLYG
ncbi:hypothetical protein PG995_001792 [Apiospora arundinis]|uniref:Uncharacterized protein n=1 Tax=Apiospora arundinis TaxID=335852 RepID=A0ABR2J7F3_9PEZI